MTSDLQKVNDAFARAAGTAGASVPTSRNVNTTAPLTGGGDLSSDRTLAVNTFNGTQSGVVPNTSGNLSTVYLDGTGAFSVPAGGGGGGAGRPGYDGVDGEDAWFGPPGPAGAAGAAGAAGIMGLPGRDGEDGMDAFPIPGPQGAQGATGSQGQSGPPGPTIVMPGSDGEDGLEWMIPGPQGNAASVGLISNGSTSGVSAGYSTDTYLAGSSIVIPVTGGWKAKTTYYCAFDMVKTGAGTATPIFTIRMGTLGTTGDASVQTVTFGAGTAAADTGIFEFWINFRTVGSGTSAVIQTVARCTHNLATTGLTNTGGSGHAVIVGTSSGFNSTTQNTIGISFNGGTSFSGTNTMVQATVTGF